MEMLLKDARVFLMARSRQFLEDFLDFISGPKKFLSRATVYNSENLARAFSFFLIIVVLINALCVFLLPEEMGWERLIVFAAAYTALFFGLTLVALQLSWLVVGARPPLRRVLLGFLYYIGIAGLLQIFLVIGMLMVVHPLSETLPVIQEFEAIPADDLAAQDAFFHENPGLLSQIMSILMVFVIYVVVDLAWLIVVWGAFRALAEVGRARSAAALLIFFLLSWIIFPLSGEFLTVFIPGAGEVPF